jgi:YVTN family beta-propeller protein
VLLGTAARGQSGENYYIYVSNERSDNVSVIDGATREAVATIPVGKRPRGIHLSPDGKTVYVAVSGTPPEPPPKLDANGNPIFQKGHDDDDDNKNADKSADGIAVIDVAQRKLSGKLPAGSDPEQFAVSPDGTRLFISNEDVGTASVLNIASGKVEKIIPVHKEPEGVGIRPDGKVFYVTCETDGEIFAVDASTFKVITHFNVGGRPRSVDFLPDGSRAFIPSESAGQMHVIDTANYQELETVALAKGSRPDVREGFPGREKSLCRHGPGRDDLRDGRGLAQSAELHQGRQAPLGHHHFAGRQISLFGQRPVQRHFGH